MPYQESKVKELEFSNPFGPTWKEDVATHNHLCHTPLQRDPYESKLVDIKESEIPKAGEGVILKTDVPSGTVVAYFNGIKFEKKDVYSWNPLNIKSRSVYLIDFEDDDGREVFLDIPKEFVSSGSYNATSGHKVSKHYSSHSVIKYNTVTHVC